MATIIPIRGLGQYGLLPDAAPHDLPLNAFSGGRNIAFRNGTVQAFPAPYLLKTYTGSPPIHPVAVYPTSFTGGMVTAHENFSINRLDNDVIYPMSMPVGWTPAVSAAPFVSSVLAGVLYINRRSHVPVYLDNSGGDWKTLPDWDPGWRCSSLRPWADYLFAINVQKGAVEYPRMIKWSDGTQDGSPPASWDISNPAERGGESIVTDADDDLVDGLRLGDGFIVYSGGDCHRLDLTGDTMIFSRRRLFGKGVINANCVVEDSGLHYVFGADDIYVHDGLRHESIIAGKARETLFRRVRMESRACFFACNVHALDSVLFAFTDRSDEPRFAGASKATTGALYNKKDSTWSFIDLPNATGFAYGTLENTMSYDDAGSAGIVYAGIGAAYADFGGEVEPKLILTAYPEGDITDPQALVYEDPTNIQTVLPGLPGYVGQSWVEKGGTAGSALGDSLDSRIQLDAVFPYIRGAVPGQPFKVYFTAAVTPAAAPSAPRELSFDPLTQYKINTRHNGRVQSIGWVLPNGPAVLSGYDLAFNPVAKT